MEGLDFDDENFNYNFEEDEFDLTATINAVFAGIELPENATKEEELKIYNKEVNSIIMKLQYQMEEVSLKAEETMQDIVLSVPALNRSMAKMEREADLLKQELGKVIEEISSLEKNNNDNNDAEGGEDDVIDQLLRLDIVKQNMTEVSTKLAKSASWDQNIRLMDEALNVGDLHKAAEQYQVLRNSIKLLEDLPLAEDREKVLHSLQNSLQKQLSPRVEMVLVDESSENFEYYVKVYETLGGQEDLINMYANNMSKILKSKWDIYDSNADKDFLNWLQSFYEAILSSLYVETKRCLKHFPNNIFSIFNQILKDVFIPIQESFNERLDSSIFAMDDFVNVYQTTTAFISAIEMLLISITDRLKSGQQKNALKLSTLAAMDIEVENTLLYVFKPFEEKFSQYELFVLEDLKLKIEDIFTKRNIDVDLKTSWDILQYLREVNSVMPQIINTIDKSLNVSLDVTHGTLINGFGHAVRDMMKTILSLQNNIRDEIRKMVRLDNIYEDNGDGDNNKKNNKKRHKTTPENRFWEVLELCIRLISFNCKIKGQWGKYHERSNLKIIERTKLILNATTNNDDDNDSGNEKLKPRRMLGKKSVEEIMNKKKASFKVNGRYLQESNDDMIHISKSLATIRVVKNKELKKSLHTFISKLENNEIDVFSDVIRYIDSSIERTLRLMYEITIAPTKYHLGQVSKYKVWGKLTEANDEDNDDGGMNSNSVYNPLAVVGSLGGTGGLGGPLEYATLIGESLLSLVQRLEQFGDFQPLQEGAITFDEVQNLVKNDWKNLIDELGVDNRELFEDASNESWNDFSKAWVAVSASGAMALFVNSILSIRFISDIGAKQLVVDITYMLNVLSALGVKAGKLMTPLKKIFEMNKDELTSLANEEDGMMENETDNDGNNRKLVQRIAKQRGIMTSSF